MSIERGSIHHYVFASTWTLPTTAERTFAVLADLGRYPVWWPEFKTAEVLGPDRGVFALRSVLPLTLHFVLQRELEEATAGRLRASATGDITGTVEWTVVAASGATSSAAFKQDVTLQHPAARIGRVLRPVLEWNHRRAMQSGANGLARYLRDNGDLR